MEEDFSRIFDAVGFGNLKIHGFNWKKLNTRVLRLNDKGFLQSH